MARPTKYKEEYAGQAKKLSMLGLIDEEMAKFFEVALSTFHLWKKEHPEFSDALNGGKTLVDAEVAAKLFHRACGYEHPEYDIRAINGEVVITPTTKHYPPDTTAAIFWLKNRQRDKWRDKPEEINEDDAQATPVQVVVEVRDARSPDAES